MKSKLRKILTATLHKSTPLSTINVTNTTFISNMGKRKTYSPLESITKVRSKYQELKRKANTPFEPLAKRLHIFHKPEFPVETNCDFCDNPIILLVCYATWENSRQGGNRDSSTPRFSNDNVPFACPRRVVAIEACRIK